MWPDLKPGTKALLFGKSLLESLRRECRTEALVLQSLAEPNSEALERYEFSSATRSAHLCFPFRPNRFHELFLVSACVKDAEAAPS